MPVYEYLCKSCGHELSKLVKMGAQDPICTKCEAEGRPVSMVKKISLSGFKLEGGGWAKDGYG